MKKFAGHIFLIALLIIVAYRQVFFLQHPLMWDTAEYFFPTRFFMAECLRHGHLPLWAPYQFTGYPFYADPQSGCWYPLMWLFSLFGRYTLISSNLEYVLYTLIGGLGMYRLSGAWTKDNSAALFTAMCYACCGLFVSNAEHLSWIISAAWLPWLFWSYYRMHQTHSYKYVGLFALFLFMMISGGYPAFLIISFYLLLVLFLVALFTNRRDRQLLAKTLKLHLALALLSAGSSIIVIYSYLQGMQFITRGNGITLERAMQSPFSIHSFLSFILPFVTLTNKEYFKTDISMSNAYFGIIALVLFLSAVITKKDKRSILVLLLAVLCLATAVGDTLPFRAFAFKWLPLMNLFRFPAAFRVFFIIGALLLAATAFSELKENFSVKRKYLALVTVSLIAVLVTIFLHAYGKVKNLSPDWKQLFLNYDGFGEHNFHTHMLVQSAIQVGILLAFLILLAVAPKSKIAVYIILLLTVTDMVWSVQKNMYGTIVDRSVALHLVNNGIANSPKGFPLPDNTQPVIAHSDNNYKTQMYPVTSNTLFFRKSIGFDGANPFQLRRFNLLEAAGIHDSVWANPLAYFADSLVLSPKQLPGKRDVYTDSATYLQLHSAFSPSQPADHIAFSYFSPNKMTLNTAADGPRLLVLQQNNIDGWQASIDGKKEEWRQVNLAYMGVIVPAGAHSITFKFLPRYLLLCAIISLCFLLGALFIACYRRPAKAAQ